MFGDKIKKRINELGLTQKDIANKLNISPSTFNGYITGYRNPDIHTISKMAKLLNIPINELIEDINEDTNRLDISASAINQNSFGHRLKMLRKEFGFTQTDLSNRVGIVRSAISNYETNRSMPDPPTLNTLAQLFNVSVDYLLGRNNIRSTDESFTPVITHRDEKDIAKELERVMESLDSDNGLMLYNNEIDDETRELLRASLENTIREAKLIAKLKYTPKKYRK